MKYALDKIAKDVYTSATEQTKERQAQLENLLVTSAPDSYRHQFYFSTLPLTTQKAANSIEFSAFLSRAVAKAPSGAATAERQIAKQSEDRVARRSVSGVGMPLTGAVSVS